MTEHELITWLREQFPSVFFQKSQSGGRNTKQIVLDWKERFAGFSNVVKQLFEKENAFKARNIVIGGTSGKGSTTLLLGHALAASGKRVGVFTSPHLCSIKERFLVLDSKGEIEVSISQLYALGQEIHQAFGQERVSFFEALFLMAGLVFYKMDCEVVVWEVGCGGRWDASNALPKKHIAVITNVELDHQALLGDTREAIANEKAPIFTRSDWVYYLNNQGSEISAVFDRERVHAGAKRLSSTEYGFEWSLASDARVVFSDQDHTLQTKLYGKGHLENLQRVAVLAHALEVPKSAFVQVAKSLTLPGRIEKCHKRPTVVIDIAHNRHKLSVLIDVLKHWPAKKRYAVVTFSEHKDVELMGGMLGDYFDYVYVTEFQPSQGRCAKRTDDVIRVASQYKASPCQFISKQTLHEAISEVVNLLTPKDQLIVTGSVFMYQEAIRSLQKQDELSFRNDQTLSWLNQS